MEQKNKIETLTEKLREADDDIINLQRQVNFEIENKNILEKNIIDLEKKLKQFENEVETLNETLLKTKNDINIKNVNIKTLENKIITLEDDIYCLKKDNENMELQINNYETTFESKLKKLNKINLELKNKQDNIDLNESKQKDLEDEINKLTNDIIYAK